MKRVTLRLPKDLHAKLEREAIDRDRSLNGQIVYCLKHYIDGAADEILGEKSARKRAREFMKEDSVATRLGGH